MWYFSWILGVSLACVLAIMNGVWYEFRDKSSSQNQQNSVASTEIQE